MNDDSEISEPHFFDVLKQPVYVGDVCLMITRTQRGNSELNNLMPVLISIISPHEERSIFSCTVTFNIHDSRFAVSRMINRCEPNQSDQFIKVQNPEFFVDSDPMAKILAKQSDLKNDLKR